MKKGTHTCTSAAVIQQVAAAEDDTAREQPGPSPLATAVDSPCATDSTSTTAGDLSTSQASMSQSTTAPSVDITPPKEGELRCGTAENKLLTHVQSDEDVAMQLQANMMLAASILLRKHLVGNPAAAASIQVITCYGMQMGPTYPLKILKMVMDFEKGCCTFEEQFRLFPCGVYPAYIDIAIEYIVRRL